MTDKQQIEEILKLDIEECAGFYSAFINDMRISKSKPLSVSRTIMSFDCPKTYILRALGISENAVVLTREEYEKYQNLKRDVEYSFEYNQGYTDGQIKGSKETAKKILKWLVNTGVINTAPNTTKMYFKEHFGVEVN